MVLKTVLKKHVRENGLYVDSNSRLEEFKNGQLVGVLLLDEKKKSMSVQYNGDTSFATYDFQREDGGLIWDCHKTEYNKGAEDFELDMSDMSSGLESLKQVGLKNSSLMPRAICGIAIQHDHAIRIGEPLMVTALRRAGLSVDENGKIDRRASVTQQNGRS